MTNKLYWDYQCKKEVGEGDILHFASILKKPLIKINKGHTTFYDKHKRSVHLEALLSPIAFMLRHRVVLPEGARSLPDRCDKKIEEYLHRSLSRRFTGATFSAVNFFRDRYTIPTLKAIASRPSSLVGDNGLVSTCATTAGCHLPVRNYREAAWVLLAIVGEERGLDIRGGKDTITYTLLDTPTGTKVSPETKLHRKIKGLVSGWVVSLLDRNSVYVEYWGVVLKNPQGYPKLLDVLSGFSNRGHEVLKDYLLYGTYGTPEKLRLQNIQRDLDKAVATLRHNAEILNTHQQIIKKLFPEDKKQMILEILEALLQDAMIHINSPGHYTVDVYRREIVTLLLEGHYVVVKEALVAKLSIL